MVLVPSIRAFVQNDGVRSGVPPSVVAGIFEFLSSGTLRGQELHLFHTFM